MTSFQRKCFTYLGICVTSSFSALLTHNFIPLIEPHQVRFRKVVESLHLIGRTYKLKMTVPTKIFILVPDDPNFFLPKSFFNQLNKYISVFIWNKFQPMYARNVSGKVKTRRWFRST